MSEVKVNKISPRTACGTTTLGDSGDTFNIPCGVTITNNGTQTGFGRTGTVDWQTGDIKTGDFTAATGKGYFINTTSGTVTATLPASPTAGDIVGLKDYALTWDTNSMFIGRNGKPINGGTGTTLEISTEGATIMLVYVDGTKGWIPTQDDASALIPVTPTYIAATGGTPCAGAVVCTNYKVHTFTGPGTFCVSAVGNCAGSNTVDYLVIAGGASAGNDSGAGGGAGGYRESNGTASGCYTVSPLATTPTTVPAITVSASPGAYAVVVGGGGAATPAAGGPSGVRGNPGDTSSALGVSSAGGGGGGTHTAGSGGGDGIDGGSGGGGRGGSHTGGAGNTPPTTPPQGQPGGDASSGITGGGGATAAGSPNPGACTAGPGGAGATSSINATPTGRAGGGGGGSGNTAPGNGGTATDGGGAGLSGPGGQPGSAATVNTGGGGGGGTDDGAGAAGGSGIVIIRYKFQ